jgi:hypothetical protein
MPEEKPSLHIDTDWKRQAQEEKKRLAEEEARKARESAAAPVSPATPPPAGAPRGVGAPRAPTAPPRGEMPPANFTELVQTLLTQILFYLGDLTTRDTEPSVNLDMAKHQIDVLAVLEEKTRGNLNDDEKRILDTALYETRMRYVSVASRYT